MQVISLDANHNHTTKCFKRVSVDLTMDDSEYYAYTRRTDTIKSVLRAIAVTTVVVGSAFLFFLYGDTHNAIISMPMSPLVGLDCTDHRASGNFSVLPGKDCTLLATK